MNRIAHYIWMEDYQPYLPFWAKSNILQFQRLNPDWDVWVWKDADLKIIENDLYLKWKELMEKWTDHLPPHQKKWERVVNKSDLLRIFILNRFGGLYMDVDVALVLPMSVILSHYPNLLARPWGVYGLMFLSIDPTWMYWSHFLKQYDTYYPRFLKRCARSKNKNPQFRTFRRYCHQFPSHHGLAQTDLLLQEVNSEEWSHIKRQKFWPPEKIGIHHYREGCFFHSYSALDFKPTTKSSSTHTTTKESTP